MRLIDELKRRNVFRVSIAYVISAWLLAQVADLVLDNIAAPDWVMQTILLVLALGFAPVAFFSWAYEVTPEGIKRGAASWTEPLRSCCCWPLATSLSISSCCHRHNLSQQAPKPARKSSRPRPPVIRLRSCRSST
jgi:hypothetical protein